MHCLAAAHGQQEWCLFDLCGHCRPSTAEPLLVHAAAALRFGTTSHSSGSAWDKAVVAQPMDEGSTQDGHHQQQTEATKRHGPKCEGDQYQEDGVDCLKPAL